jgi:hypothetical protein
MFALEQLRAPVESLVAEHLQRPWVAQHSRDMTEFACHPAAIVSDGTYAVFAKYASTPDAMHLR